MDPAVKVRVVVVIMLAAIMACQLGEGAISPTQAPQPGANPTATGPWYEVYFTDPTDPKSDTLRGGPDAHLAEAIREARVSVDLAVLELNLWSIRDALLNAHRRGVKVRVVIETEYRDAKEVKALIDAGVPLLTDRREGLMHDKFAVIDRQDVWTGSMNFSITDGYRNNNNLIRIRSAELAESYTVEFEEMFLDDRFGPGSPADTPNPSIAVGEVRIEVCFSPDDGCAAQIIQALNRARDSIYFMAFSFTADDLAAALFARHKAGVEVIGVMEAEQVNSNAGTQFLEFQRAGLDVRKDGNRGNMHHKVFIIDRKIVVTGSYNFSYYAETRNDENVLILYSPEIAALYLREFEKIFDQGVK